MSKIILALFCSMTFASTPKQYRIHAEVYVDGKLVSSPGVIAIEGEAATISDSSLKMTVVASDSKKVNGGILLKLNVDYAGANTVIKSAPKVLAMSGTPSIVTITDKQGKPNMQMRITAARGD